MPTVVVHTQGDVDRLAVLLKGRKMPLSVTYETGRARSIEQNRLQRLWCREVADQMGDRTAEEVRGVSKLHFGVPILRAENDAFRAAYDRVLKPLAYEDKLAAMMEPLDFAVTRLMSVAQKTRYLDAMHRHWSGEGVRLTDPDPLGTAA